MPRGPSTIREADGVLYVQLTMGLEAVVDVADRGVVDGYRWATLTTPGGHVYAYRHQNGKCILLHRELLSAPRYMRVDHEDGNGLDNRRKNIRLATPSQNNANRGADSRNLLGIKGVQRYRNRFRAYINPGGKRIHLGYFDTAEEAAAAYTGAAKVVWGRFAFKAR